MARFSAYTSDTSEGEEENESSSSSSEGFDNRTSRLVEPDDEDSEEDGDVEEESEETDETESEDSEMLEEELVNPLSQKKKPTRNALVQDDDGDVYYAHEFEGSQHALPLAESSSRTQNGDPTIIPWAQQVGIDAQKMHVMQTSLFRMPEEAASLQAMNRSTRPRLLLPLTLNRKHSRESDGDLRLDSRERASFAHDIEPPVYRPSRKYARVESSASAVNGNESAIVDAGLSQGRSFRVGWGPAGVLVHSGELCGLSSTLKTSANSSTIFKTSIPIASVSSPNDTNRMAKLLQHHLSHSPISPDADGIPFANPSSKLCFSSFASLFPPADQSYEASLFRLGQCLFDRIDLHISPTVTVDIKNRVASIRRKAALSNWLEETVAPYVDTDLKSNLSATSAAVVFTLLTGNQIDKACEAAMNGGSTKLATLISQAGGDIEFKDDIREQLSLWQEQRIDAHIDESTRKIYALLAGILDIVEGSKGSGPERCVDIDAIKSLDWKRTFGLHLWYSEPMDATVAQIFQSYERSWKQTPSRVSPPFPAHSQDPSHRKDSSPDGLYSLIRLHADPACSLSHVLIPLSFSSSPIDYSLPWHLYILLSRCMRIRDFSDRGDPGVHMDNNEEEELRVEGHSPSADLLASSFALQLEQLGMLQEALFVLLHIEGSAGREKAVKELLSRNAPKLDEWMIRGIVGSLKIPMTWVNEAKAIHALDSEKVYEAYELYIAAKLFSAAHDLAVFELAPDAIIRQDLDLLKDLFAKLSGQSVDGWHFRGKLYLDYVHAMTRIPELLSQVEERGIVPDPTRALEIEELAKSIPKLIGALPDVLRDRSDIRHNAALSEMIAGLTLRLDKIKPLALPQSLIRPAFVEEATLLRHIHSTALERFMKTIEVS